ncbi:hypothetical protein SLEP1_g35426 [Rubroshorea leprosula]|uniref:Inactive shikimate kinase like 1, chloroplastic n=1 Tax=Rubroshorea leprosula TaxID=152421 RepID=A0AAV5KNM6_9ROSI|nr:hypothetical protein SLEP1_g35426 [Rubroshorea leprosula]
MEIVATSRPSLITLQFQIPFLRFSFPMTYQLNPPPQSSPPTFLRSQFLSFSRLLRRKSVSVTCSFADDSTSSTEVGTVDPSLALKKRAADVGPELKGTSIFLVGMNNSIKSNLGKLLAGVLRYYYFDSDGLVAEASGGESAAKSFRESDEKRFRESETEVLKELSSLGRLVVCAGNGAVQSSTNLALLRHGISIWIDVPLDMVAKGITEDRDQIYFPEISPGSYSEVLSQLTALYEETKSGYATADAIVSLQKIASQADQADLDAVTAEEMTMEVLKEIERLTRVKKMMEEAARPF